jgi:mitochondrial ornithine carrier protein
MSLQTAGIVGKFIEYPFDTIKVRLQSQPPGPPLYTGPLDCLRQSIHHSGPLSLYRGISAPLFGAAVETSSLFFSYRIAQEFFQSHILHAPKEEPLPFSALLACGAASGAFTSFLLTPIELVKCKMQVPVPAGCTPPGPISIIVSIFRHQGLRGFWHGQLGTLIRETGGSAAWFGSYEAVTALFRRHNAKLSSTPSPSVSNKDLPIYQQLLAGATAGVSYNFVFYPADTIKSLMQTSDVTDVARNGQQKFWNTGKVLWREQGIRGFYRGCGITVGRAAPSSALIFAVYEGLRGYFG